jgi:hypothetical protein
MYLPWVQLYVLQDLGSFNLIIEPFFLLYGLAFSVTNQVFILTQFEVLCQKESSIKWTGNRIERIISVSSAHRPHPLFGHPRPSLSEIIVLHYGRSWNRKWSFWQVWGLTVLAELLNKLYAHSIYQDTCLGFLDSHSRNPSRSLSSRALCQRSSYSACSWRNQWNHRTVLFLHA